MVRSPQDVVKQKTGKKENIPSSGSLAGDGTPRSPACAESDLYYYRARYYDPGVGRFASEDPLGFAAGDVNLSRYVGNGPTNGVDPSGLVEISGLTPWQWMKTTGVLFYEWGANGYRAGKAIVTGEAGHQMGERAVLIVQQESHDKFDGDRRDWCRFSYVIAQEMTGANAIAEGGVGIDRAHLVQLDSWQRGTRISSGTGVMAGTAALGFSVAGKLGVGVGMRPIPGTPNMPKVPIPGRVREYMNRPIRIPFRRLSKDAGELFDASESVGAGKLPFKKPKPGASGKAGSTDIPSWAKGERPLSGEAGKDFAKRLMDGQYGESGWARKGQQGREFSQLKKYCDRHFED